MSDLAAPSLAPPVGLIGESIGNVTSPWQSLVPPSTAFEGQDWFGLSNQLARGIGNAQAELGTVDDYGRQVTPPEPPIGADEANKTYGIPGKLTFSAPVPASVAQSMNDAKRDEIAREDAAARAPPGFWPNAARMGAGFVAGALDPLNLAALFVPGLGEARTAGMLARAGLPGLGGDVLADVAEGGAAAIPNLATRTAVRGVTGAIGGMTAQAPLVALHYGLSRQEQGDYSAMDALGDVMTMGAGLGALGHVGFGAIGDVLGQRFVRSAAGAAVADDPATAEAATRTAVAQMVQGNPVEVSPVLAAAPLTGGRPAAPQSLLSFLVARGGIQDQGGDLAAMDARRGRVALVRASGMPLDYAREAAEEAGYLRPNSTVADLLNRIGDELSGRKAFTPEEEATATGMRMAQAGQDEQDRFLEAREQVSAVTERRRLNLTDEEHNNAAMMTMQGLHPEDAVNEAFGQSAADANAALRGARGTPEWQHQNRSAAAPALQDRPMWFSRRGNDFHGGAFTHLARLHLARPFVESDADADPALWDSVEAQMRHNGGSDADVAAFRKERRDGFGAVIDPRVQRAMEDLGYDSIVADATWKEGGFAVPFHPPMQVEFEQALRYAHGEPLPEEAAITHMADTAARGSGPDGRGGVPSGVETQLADIHDALARADAAGLIGEPERAEMAAANGWIDQAKNYAQGVLQAAACIARGMV